MDEAGWSGSRARRYGPDSQRLDIVHFSYEHFRLSQLRLTGGEPLLHLSIVALISAIRETAPHLALAMTTNSWRLATLVSDLRHAGLDRLNISLDSLDPQRYRDLTGGDLEPVLKGIDQAMAVGFEPPKVDTVVFKDVNDCELAKLAEWSFSRGLEIRSLEAMPIGPASVFNRKHFVPAAVIRAGLGERFELRELPRISGETAMRYAATANRLKGTIGIIAPVTERFCGQCRRMRITADGNVYPCLLDERHVDLRWTWKDRRFLPDVLERMILEAIRGEAAAGPAMQATAMVQLGGWAAALPAQSRSSTANAEIHEEKCNMPVKRRVNADRKISATLASSSAENG